jgi:NAD+ kinase
MKRILLYANNKKASVEAKENLNQLLVEHGYEVVTDKPDLIVVFGGDGTMLSAIRKYRTRKVPFIGVNTGTLGFLPSVPPSNLEIIMDILENKNYSIQSYPLLEVKCKTVKGDEIDSYAFNEILIKHLEPRLMEAKIYINGKPFNYFTGDGFIVSTPIGSTGYAIWAGGVATHSELPVYQLTPLNANDNSINRPLKSSLVVPIETMIDFHIIKSKYRAVIVACDGRKVSDDFISEIHVQAAHKEVQILRWGNYDYFELYKNKIIDKNLNNRVLYE